MLLEKDILSDRDFARISAAVHKHCGINLHEGKRELVQARLTKLLRHCRFSSTGEFLDYVLEHQDGPDFVEFIDSLSTNLTSFFRESEHFDYLADQFLPKLLAKKRSAGQSHASARWSAASSTGEEPYSIAMTMLHAADTGAPATRGAGLDALLLATDISTRVLRIAREAVYDQQRTQPVPGHLRSRYLVKSRQRAGALEPTAEVRAIVHFAHLNLMETWPFSGPLDFIFCRNVMIYFDKPTQQRLIDRFCDILDSGGLLFTGHSESLTGIAHQFRYVQPTIYQKS